ncbi:hypothetical protein [Acidithiobacillus thiooxidans]|uniref:hypothetical protein n=1 Tax=Acidithiobacillus thiooxidans TaxID=930 RepID=UPI003565DDAA|nr:hypothetical protein [Acidithiobacillus sp.]
MFKPYRIYPLLGAALLLAPVGGSAKTEISWAQYLQGMHFLKYHGIYNKGVPNLACRQGGVFHSSRYYSSHHGYRNVPAPNPRRQDYMWQTPTAMKGSIVVGAVTSKKRGFTTSIYTPDAVYTLIRRSDFQIKGATLSSGGPVGGWRSPLRHRCAGIATAGGDLVPGPLYGSDPQNRFYRLGPCQGAGHRGTAYEVWTPARTHIYCVDHQYMLYSFDLDNKGFWQKNAGPGSVMAKEYPKLAAFATRMFSHPTQKQGTPWPYAGGPSTFTALTRIGGVHIQVPPSWWHPNGHCSSITFRDGGKLTTCKY